MRFPSKTRLLGVAARGAIALLLLAVCAHARDYFVATTGSDSNPGTLAQPYLTIQKAATVAVAGDNIFIRAGTYRETVTPARSGNATQSITFRSYNNEVVTISGADVVPSGSWTLSSGTIYQTPMSWDLGEGENQVFLDGQMMIEARWPNTTLDVSHPIFARTATGSVVVDGGSGVNANLSTGTITDQNLTKPAGYWTGGTIHILPRLGWSWQTGPITNSPAGQLTFTYLRWGGNNAAGMAQLVPSAQNPYFLTGKLSELDSGGEWFREGTTSTLYFWTPGSDSPAQHLIEVKRRDYAFILNGRSFITIQGLNLFAATINSDTGSQYLVLDGLNAKYVSHYTLNSGTPGVVTACCEHISDSGILLKGRNGVLRNSTIALSSGNGVTVLGIGNRVFNNVIHDTDYAGNPTAPVRIVGSTLLPTGGFIVAWNTLYNTARDGVDHSNDDASMSGRILHNEIYDYGLQTSDLGCTYSANTDGQGTEIAYNLCHDSHALSGFQIGAGIYLDNNSHNFIVHHNAVWNLVAGNGGVTLALNSVSTNNKVFNNTFTGGSIGLNRWDPLESTCRHASLSIL